MAENQPNDDRTQSFTILTKGSVVGHYKIIEKIGAGGMGEVYLAEDPELKRQVAIKLLPAQFAASEDLKARFKREAQAAAALNHPNIITIFEVGEYQGRPFFAMEHVVGSPLGELSKDKDLSTGKIIDLAVQMAAGLSKAHQAGIFHRDIKPGNIIVDSDGRPKILDFGLAVVKGSEKLTQTGSTLGTIGYMSPEQVHGEQVDARSDLFSLGVVLYEMIAGRTPFRGDNQASTLHAIVHDTPEPLARFKTHVPDELQRIVSKLLEKDPALRFQSADGLISDLKRLEVSGELAVVTRPPKKLTTPLLVGAVVALLSIIAVATLYNIFTSGGKRPSAGRVMLAVLPFENLGSPDEEYFADGITEEITVNLARLSGLGVISRKSAVKYKNSEKSLREIAKELGVDYVLEGTIRWDKSGEKDRVLITPQLIHVADDVNLWAKRYDTVLSDIFAVQANVAESVAEALNVTLLDAERADLAERPTENTEAYDYYLRGNQYFAASTSEGFRNAVTMYETAIKLESEFALAYAKMGMAHIQMYWWYYDHSPERLTAAKDAVDRALEISPELAEGHFALGWYYYHGHFDYDQALAEFAIARQKQPNNSQLMAAVAYVQRRQGKWEKAVNNFKIVIELDPRNALVISDLAGTFVSLRDYEEADRLFDLAIGLAPDLRWGYIQKCLMSVFQAGNTTRARQILQDALQNNERWPNLTNYEIWLDIIDGQYEHACGFLTGPGKSYILETTDTAEYYFQKGDLYRHMQNDLSQVFYDSARVLLEGYVAAAPDDPYFHLFLGRVYAGLGRKDDAIRESRRMVELYPVSQDAFSATDLVGALAEIYTMVGEEELALDQLEYLLSIPAWISVKYIQIWPEFAPLWDHARFKKLVAEHGG